ncbi:MAG: ABC transporter permease [Anaerolineales bacterium]|nr:ABC transporter permease [Anaerolineales bacterium]
MQTELISPEMTNEPHQSDRSKQLRKLMGQSAIYIILLVLIVVASLISPVFLRARSITNLLRQASTLGIVSVGQTFVILTGSIDLSVASVMALMSVLAANLMKGEDSLALPVALLCLGVAVIIGLVNGLMITKLRIPAFIATLGTILIVQGIRFVYTGGAPKGSIPEALRFWGRGALGPIPTAVIIWVVIIIAAVVILRQTTLGRRIYAVGGNPHTAHLSGVNVHGVIIASHVICSFLAGVAGLVLTAYIGLADNWLGRGFELDSIATVVVGGTALQGGKGSVLGSVAGVLIITILFNLVLQLNLDEETQRIVKGIVIIAALALYVRLRPQES